MHNLHIFRNQTYKLDKIQPLENGTLVTFINNGLFAMVEQLNNFACYVESRLVTLNRQIDTCYSNLVILEMKLNSINIPDDKVTTSQAPPNATTSMSETAANDQLKTKGDIEGGETPTNEEADHIEAAQEDHSEELEKYRKMLKLGVHEGAVRQKMLLEGVDPARLKL
ncbi:Pfam:DUF2360 [Tyrophagus putrescentiae]|nr:Pfam:DUF2360 [Tyrophagus putrescentiae]